MKRRTLTSCAGRWTATMGEGIGGELRRARPRRGPWPMPIDGRQVRTAEPSQTLSPVIL